MYTRLQTAKREISIATTFALAARGFSDKTLLSTDLKRKKILFTDNA